MTQLFQSSAWAQRTLHSTPQMLAQLGSLPFSIARKWKQFQCPSADKLIIKMWYIYIMEYYSALRKNEMIKFVDNWMELENIISSTYTHIIYSIIYMYVYICYI